MRMIQGHEDCSGGDVQSAEEKKRIGTNEIRWVRMPARRMSLERNTKCMH